LNDVLKIEHIYFAGMNRQQTEYLLNVELPMILPKITQELTKGDPCDHTFSVVIYMRFNADTQIMSSS